MLCWTLNIIWCLQHNNLKSKPLHVFNPNVWLESYDIVSTNFCLIWRKFYLAYNLLLYAAVSKLSFRSLVNTVWSVSLIYGLIYSPKITLKHILYHCSTLMQSMCVNQKNGNYIQIISSRRDFSLTSHYKICSELILCFARWVTFLKELGLLSWITKPFDR